MEIKLKKGYSDFFRSEPLLLRKNSSDSIRIEGNSTRENLVIQSNNNPQFYLDSAMRVLALREKNGNNNLNKTIKVYLKLANDLLFENISAMPFATPIEQEEKKIVIMQAIKCLELLIDFSENKTDKMKCYQEMSFYLIMASAYISNPSDKKKILADAKEFQRRARRVLQDIIDETFSYYEKAVLLEEKLEMYDSFLELEPKEQKEYLSDLREVFKNYNISSTKIQLSYSEKVELLGKVIGALEMLCEKEPSPDMKKDLKQRIISIRTDQIAFLERMAEKSPSVEFFNKIAEIFLLTLPLIGKRKKIAYLIEAITNFLQAYSYANEEQQSVCKDNFEKCINKLLITFELYEGEETVMGKIDLWKSIIDKLFLLLSQLRPETKVLAKPGIYSVIGKCLEEIKAELTNNSSSLSANNLEATNIFIGTVEEKLQL